MPSFANKNYKTISLKIIFHLVKKHSACKNKFIPHFYLVFIFTKFNFSYLVDFLIYLIIKMRIIIIRIFHLKNYLFYCIGEKLNVAASTPVFEINVTVKLSLEFTTTFMLSVYCSGNSDSP